MTALLIPVLSCAALNMVLACLAFWWARSSSRAAQSAFPLLAGVLVLGAFTIGAWPHRAPFQWLVGGAVCAITALVLALPGVGLALRASRARGSVASALAFPLCAAAALGSVFPVLAFALGVALTGDSP